MAKFLWLSWLLLATVSALPWPGPPETISANPTANWSPVPTMGMNEFFERKVYPVNLCGWQGPTYQGAYCGSDSYCAWFTDYSVVGCCQTSGSCDAVYTSCIDGKHDEQSVSYPGVLTCTGRSLCYLNKFPASFSQYGCGSTSTGETVVTSWSGINTADSIYVAVTGGVLETASNVTLISNTLDKSSSNSNATSASATSSVVKNSATSTRPSTPTSPATYYATPTTPVSANISTGLSTAAIASIAVIATLVLLFIFVTILIRWGRHRKRAAAAAATPERESVVDQSEKSAGPAELQGSDHNAVELPSPDPTNDSQYTPSPLQSPVQEGAVPAVSPLSSTVSPNPHHSGVFELPAQCSNTHTVSGLGIAELDGFEVPNSGMPPPNRGSKYNG